MHELRAARDIIELVEREMSEQGLTRVETVNVRVGALSCINGDALRFGFEAAVSDTPLQGARLEIEKIPVQARCRSCKKVTDIDPPAFVCSHCSETDLDVIAGEELYIDYIIGV